MTKYVAGAGSTSAKLMVVGELPEPEEESSGEAFTGQKGQMVQQYLREAGMGWSEVYRTLVIKHRPAEGRAALLKILGKKVEDYYEQLWAEINAIKPNCILALGEISLKALTGKSGITHFRGSILHSARGYPKIVPSLHPASIFKAEEGSGVDYSARVYIALDFERAVAESTSKEFNLPVRTLQVAKSSLDVWRFLQQNKDKKRVALDIEVIKAIPICIGMAFSSKHGLSIPLLNVDSWKDIGIPKHDLALIWKMVAEFLEQPDLEIIGQNWKFDHEKILRTIGIRLPDPYADTSILGHTLHSELPKSLEFLTSVYTREPYYKFELKEYNPKKDKIEDLFVYNAKDCVVTFECLEKMYPDLIERSKDGPKYNFSDTYLVEYFHFKMKLHRIYLDMEAEGILVDRAKQKELWHKYDNMVKFCQESLAQHIGRPVGNKKGELNISSPKQLADLLYKQIGFPLRGSTDEETLSALWANHCDKDQRKRDVLDLILKIRQAKKSRDTYLGAKPDYDGRMRTNYRICGTETGRTSTSLLKPPVRPEKIGLTFQNMTKHGDVGADIGSILVADPGCVILVADLSQAEPRNVAVLSKDWDLLGQFGKTDIHKMTAGWFFGLSDAVAQKMDKEDPRRFIGKTGRNGGNYDMGKRRLMQTINTDAKKYMICQPGSIIPIQVSEWKAGQISDIFHRKSPKIRGVFHQDIIKALTDNERTLVNPYGQTRQFLGRWGNDLFKEAFAHYPQSTVSDHVKHAMVGIRKDYPPARFVMESHDALAFLVRYQDRKELAEVVKKWFEMPIDFSRGSLRRDYQLIIPADFQVGENYADLEKYKWD